MNTMNQKTLRISTLFLVVAALLGFALVWASEAQAATLPAETCAYDGGTNTRTCELWATTGTLSLPGGDSVPIWGYADTAGADATLPGPAIIANQGETVQVILHNSLGETTGLLFQGQAMVPDLVGVTSTFSKTYTLSDVQPGTYLYEAALLPNAQHQVAMGMFGAFVVRPAGASGQAYAGAATAFNDEALVLLSEIDPALNNAADPANFDMRDFTPRYWLINGKAYPQTDAIQTTAGHQVLLRYINAGLEPHTMDLLGLDQALLGVDGSALPYARKVTANTVAPGQTVDALAYVPAATLDGTRLALYDGSFVQHNNGAAGFGGMLTFFEVAAAGGGNGGGPVTSNTVAAPSPTTGLVDVTVTAMVTSTTPYTVTAAEFFIDVPGADGTGIVMTATDTVFDTDNEDVTGTILAADVAALSAGTHTIYVHGQDSAGVWGGFDTATLTVDKSGPTTSGVMLAPNPTDEKVDVVVSATMTVDATSAEFYIDATTGTTPTVMSQAGTGEWTGTILATSADPADVTLATLASGDHTIYVRGQNTAGVWGAFNFAVLHLDKDGPATKALVLSPNPSNGSVAVALSATGDDTMAGGSNIIAAEYFTGTPGIDGSALNMSVNQIASIASLTGTIPAGLTAGTYTVTVHSMDEWGHWGPYATIDLIVDGGGPTASNVTATPNLLYSPVAVRVDADLTDVNNVKKAEGFIDTDQEPDGTGFPLTPRDGLFNSPSEAAYATIPFATVNALQAGIHTVYIHGMDSSGNWGDFGTTTFEILPDLIFADSFETGLVPPWSAVSGTNVTVFSPSRTGSGMQVALDGANVTGFVTDDSPLDEPGYHVRFYFDPNGMAPGNGNNSYYTILAGLDSTNPGQEVFRIEYRRRNAGGGTYEVRGVVTLSDGTTSATNWYNINNNAWNAIEVSWQSSATASFSLYINGVLRQSVTGQNTAAWKVGSATLGPSGGTGVGTGTMHFDDFVSTRNTYIGP